MQSESVTWSSSDAGFKTVRGGRYLVGCKGSNYGTVALQALLPDGSTAATVPDIAAAAVSFSADGWKTVDLAPGQYKVTITSATSVSVSATSIPT